MDTLHQLGVALGLATLAGVNLYLTVLLTGVAVRFNFLQLADQYQSLEVLSHPAVLIVAGILFALEFFADKIPFVDSLWDSFHTIVRPVGGVMLGVQSLGEVPPYMQVVAALIAGGAAFTAHSAKAGTRLLINHSPEPVSNVAMSVTEDVAVVGGTALTLLSPVIALIVFSVILLVFWMLAPRLWRGVRGTVWLAWNKLRMPGRRQPFDGPVDLPRSLNNELRDLLQIKGSINDSDVRHAVKCLSGKCRGVRGLCADLEGVLVVTHQKDAIYFAAFKGLSSRLFKLPLAGASVEVESKFLSENLVLQSHGLRAVFRLPRGQSEVVETLALAIDELLAASKVAQQPLGAESVDPEPEPDVAPESELVEAEVVPMPAGQKEPVSHLHALSER